MLVTEVQTAEGAISGIDIVPVARPFFAADDALPMAPPDGLLDAEPNVVDSLAWYAMA